MKIVGDLDQFDKRLADYGVLANTLALLLVYFGFNFVSEGAANFVQNSFSRPLPVSVFVSRGILLVYESFRVFVSQVVERTSRVSLTIPFQNCFVLDCL